MQATLDGIAEVQAPALPVALVKVAIVAQLADAAVVRVTGEHEVQTEVLLHEHQPDDLHVLPILAVFIEPDWGSFALTHECALKRAARLPAGSIVAALGHGLRTARHQGAQVLRLVHCDGISPELTIS